MTTQNEDKQTQDAALTAKRGTPAKDVRTWLQKCTHGTLGTLQAQATVQGFPMGSIVPFAVDRQGRPVVLLAGIAAHTKNLTSDNRASLFIHDPDAKGDPQASWRASIIGRFSKLMPHREQQEGSASLDDTEIVSDAEWDALMARYTERVPQAPGYRKTHGFALWRMSQIETIRYIAGFGKICWIAGADYRRCVQEQAHHKMEARARTHMNEDHVENMKELCRGYFGVDPSNVRMVELDIGGCLLQTHEPEGLHFCSFTTVVDEPGAYKTEIIQLLHRARSRVASM